MPSTPTSPRRQSSISSSSSSDASVNYSPFTFPRFHPDFFSTIWRLQRRLIPLRSSSTGEIPPHFPPNLLAFHLLTSSQLDELARGFHQIWPPVEQTSWYPAQIPPWIGTPQEAAVDLETKRRRFGRFIGLRGCESPIENATSSGDVDSWFNTGKAGGRDNERPFDFFVDEPVRANMAEQGVQDEAVQRMLEQMEREWQWALERAHGEHGSEFDEKWLD